MSTSAQKITFESELGAVGVGLNDGRQARLRVLLVDEQAHVLRVLRTNLDRQGYEVDMATTSETALTKIRQRAFDVLIVTSDLPEMSARRFCKSIEEQSFAKGALVLVGAPNKNNWIESSSHAEHMEPPLSLRWIVDRIDRFSRC